MSEDTVAITTAELADLRLAADRYRWIWQRAVRVQGDPTSYRGHYLDIQCDVGREHVVEVQALEQQLPPRLRRE